MIHDTLTLLANSRIVRHIDIIEDDPGEKISILKLRVILIDRSILSITEIEKTDEIKYSYNWQKTKGDLIMRWDNAPHWKHLKTYPHHKHLNRKTVVETNEVTFAEVLAVVENQVGKKI